MEGVGVLGFLFGIIAFTYGMSTSSRVTSLTDQVTQLRVEHEVLKKNLKELGVLKEAQNPEGK